MDLTDCEWKQTISDVMTAKRDYKEFIGRPAGSATE